MKKMDIKPTRLCSEKKKNGLGDSEKTRYNWEKLEGSKILKMTEVSLEHINHLK